MKSFSIRLGLFVSLFAVPCAFAEDAPKLICKQTYQEKADSSNSIKWMGFSPDGKHLAAVKAKNQMSGDLLIFKTDKEEKPALLDSDVLNGMFDPQSRSISYVSGEKMKHTLLPGQQPLKNFETELEIPTKFDRKSGRIFPSHNAGEIYLLNTSLFRWNTVAKKSDRIEVRTTKNWDYLPSALHSKTERFASTREEPGVGDKYVIEVWDFSKEPKHADFAPEHHPFSMEFSPDGSRLAVGLPDGSIHLLDPAKAESTLHLQVSPKPAQFTISTLAFEKTGRFLVCGSYDRGGDHNLFIVDTQAKKVIRSFVADENDVVKICLSEKGDRLAVAGMKYISIFDAKDLFKPEAEMK